MERSWVVRMRSPDADAARKVGAARCRLSSDVALPHWATYRQLGYFSSCRPSKIGPPCLQCQTLSEPVVVS